jgi:hypothetical protein
MHEQRTRCRAREAESRAESVTVLTALTRSKTFEPSPPGGASIDESRPQELPSPSDYEGLWVSEGLSLYTFDGACFRCVSPHSFVYRGWAGKVAVKDVRINGTSGSGLQAFRDRATGTLTRWVPVRLDFEPDVVTKRFPSDVPAGELVYGHQERYRRVSSSDKGRRSS